MMRFVVPIISDMNTHDAFAFLRLALAFFLYRVFDFSNNVSTDSDL